MHIARPALAALPFYDSRWRFQLQVQLILLAIALLSGATPGPLGGPPIGWLAAGRSNW